jgi:glycosyltransferase involved in cell wall biosynthesis
MGMMVAQSSLESLKVLMLGPGLAVKGGITSVEKLILENVFDGISIVHIETYEDSIFFHKLFIFISAIWRLLNLLLLDNVDLVHIHISQRGSVVRQSIALILIAMFQKATVIHAHGSEFKSFYINLPGFAKSLLSSILSLCDRFIVLSNSWEQFYSEIVGLSEEKIVVLPNPVKWPQIINRDYDDEKVKFLFLGRVGERKGTFDLVNAFALIPDEKRNNVSLIVAGDGETAELSVLISQLELENHVKVLGWINPDKRDQLLSESSIFVLPSYNEGLPMALLESMAWGLPVITTPVGGVPEFVQHLENGILIEPGDIHGLSANMVKLANDKSLRIAIGKSARESMKPLSIENYSYSLQKIYYSIFDFGL